MGCHSEGNTETHGDTPEMGHRGVTGTSEHVLQRDLASPGLTPGTHSGGSISRGLYHARESRAGALGPLLHVATLRDPRTETLDTDGLRLCIRLVFAPTTPWVKNVDRMAGLDGNIRAQFRFEHQARGLVPWAKAAAVHSKRACEPRPS